MKTTTRTAIGVCLVLSLVAREVAAQSPPATQSNATNKLFGTPEQVPDIRELSISANQVTAVKFLQMIREKTPSFQFVAIAGQWESAMMPQLELRDVDVDQVVSLMRQLVPSLNVNFEAGKSPFYVFRDQPGSREAGGNKLTAFGLNDPVDRLALRKSWSVTAYNDIAPTPEQIAKSREAALREILSLLEAAIAQSSAPGAAPTLKLHEETGVLLMRGTAAQIAAASQALDALKSGDDPNQLRVKYERLSREYEDIKSRNTNLEARMRNLQSELDRVMPGRSQTLRPTPMTQPSNPSGQDKH